MYWTSSIYDCYVYSWFVSFSSKSKENNETKKTQKKVWSKGIYFFNQKCSQSKLYVTQFPKTIENMYEEILILVLKCSPNKLWLTILVPPNFTKTNLPSRALFENNFSFLPLQKLGLTHGKKYGSRILKLCI